ncbi:helix-turn-helix transcriptional regulator [uncultured Bacteroides sp.]|uniref:helix-turn-helix domain-containing protein n=1 Tax=uncultured Bacteroides sp. TaxID=162156 RepID=UPI0025E39DB5|nr:helix-turn-helix transcriptional regulator [uncultured Bacteroides sp.]
MNPLLTTLQETFRSGTDSLEYFHNRLVKMNNGALIFCIQGAAEITIDLQKYHIVPNTSIIILPKSIFSLISATEDFNARYFAYSDEMFKAACFRLEPPFIHFLKENACYTHTQENPLRSIRGLITASEGIYLDFDNRFRETIAQNLLQIFFFDTFDKVSRLFTPEQIKGSNRREELFKKFIILVHTYCTTQRDVAFYAEQLCISTRYLSSITNKIAKNSAKEIIDEILILELKVALQSTDLSLKEIADKYRFPDQSFFGRYFKKHTGMSPKEYRTKKK